MEPYVGLGHFTEDFADRFFGRDTECSLIIGNLRAARLTLLYAESGVGKSSLLRAGVVARLHEFAEHDVEVRGRPRLVPVVFSSWSEAPVAGLVRALAEAARSYLPEGERLDLPEDDLERALEVVGAALDTTLLVVLDQFEEYFLYPEEAPEEKRIAAQIARCVNRADLRANFLISIREDSYARLGDLFRGKVTNVYANFLHLDFLGRDGARESIEKPIERINELGTGGEPYELEPALVEAVLDQVGRGRVVTADEDGHRNGDGNEIETTYLQLVMRRLWEEETDAGSRRLRLRTLEGLGGSQAVITSHLDRAMDAETEGASLTAEQRLVAASIFHFLVTSGGTKIALTARDLSDLSGRSVAEIEPVLRHLSSPALHILRPVVSENGQGELRYEIFHDALARPIVAWRTRVEEAELEARLRRERTEKEKAQRAAAEAEQRERSQRRRMRFALTTLVLIVIAGVLIALARQEEVSDRRQVATQSVRASGRIAELSGVPTFGPTAAALAGLEAYTGLSATEEARDQILAQLQLNPALPKVAVGHTRAVKSVAYVPGSEELVSGGLDGTVRFWDAEGKEAADRLVVSDGGGVYSVAVSERLPGGDQLLAAGQSGYVKLWKLEPSGEVKPLPEVPLAGGGEVWGLAFNPRVPTMLAVGERSGRLELVDLRHPADPVVRGVRRHQGEIFDLAFSANGRRLLTASSSGGREWKISGSRFAGSRPRNWETASLLSVAVGPDGALAFGGNHGISVRGAGGRWLYLPQPAEVTSLAFARDGTVLVSGDYDWNVTTWDLASGRPFGPPRTADRTGVFDLAVDPDDGTIAAAGNDGLVKLWPFEPRRSLATTVGGLSPSETGPRVAELRALAVDERDGLVAAAGVWAGMSIWRLGDSGAAGSAPRPLTRIPGHTEAVASAGGLLAVARRHSFVLEDIGEDCASMPSRPCRLAMPARAHSVNSVGSMAMKRQGGRLLLLSSGFVRGGSVINVWDVTDARATGEIDHLSTRKIHSRKRINQVAFSPVSPLVVAATDDGKLRVWDVTDPAHPEGSRIKNPQGNEEQPVYAVAFSSDGELLASGGGDQQVVLWKVTRNPSGAPAVEPTGDTLFQTQTIFSLAFSPSGETLAVGDGDGLTCLYAVAGPDKIGGRSCLAGHSLEELGSGGIRAIEFAQSPGGATSLLTAGTGQPIVAWRPILWNLSHSDRVEREIERDACALASLNLTPSEWSAVFRSTELAGDRDKTCSEYALPDE